MPSGQRHRNATFIILQLCNFALLQKKEDISWW